MSWSLSYLSVFKCEAVDMVDESWRFRWKAVRNYFGGYMENSVDLVRRVRSNVEDLIFLLTTRPSSFNSNCSWLTCFLGYSRFPYKEEIINTWFVQNFPSEDTGKRKVNVMNVDREGKRTKIYRTQGQADNFPNSLSDDQFDVFFHGTNHESAQDIIEHGIDLSKARKGVPQDFSDGDGYYLCNSFEETLKWVGSDVRQGEGQAIVIYRVDKRELRGDNNDKGLDLRGDNLQWVRVVSEYRIPSSGKPAKKRSQPDNKLRKHWKTMPYIEGPISSGSKNPSYADFDCSKGTYQLCVRTDNCAQLFDKSLHSVVFVEG